MYKPLAGVWHYVGGHTSDFSQCPFAGAYRIHICSKTHQYDQGNRQVIDLKKREKVQKPSLFFITFQNRSVACVYYRIYPD